MKVKKVKSIQQLKKEADRWCSEWIRRKDADREGYCFCFTCGKRDHYKRMQAGHYISRVYGNTRYYEPNLKVQCPACNIFKYGNMEEYAIRLERETPGILEKLHKYKMMPPTPFKAIDLIDLIQDFKNKIKGLNK